MILGSLAIFGLILTLGPIAGVVVVAMLAVLGTAGASEDGTSGLVGVSLTLVLAFYLGGHVAGRMAARSGARHGYLEALLALVVAMFLAVVGAFVGSGLVNDLSGARLPSAPEDVRNLSTLTSVCGVLALILPFVGGAMGGVRGANNNMGRKRPQND